MLYKENMTEQQVKYEKQMRWKLHFYGFRAPAVYFHYRKTIKKSFPDSSIGRATDC
jgi:hypothetical protein